MSDTPLSSAASVLVQAAPAVSPLVFQVDFAGSLLPAYTFTVVSQADGFVHGTLFGNRPALVPLSEIPSSIKPLVGVKFMVSVIAPAARPVCSASRPDLVAALYAGIAPEVRSGVVRIMNVARVSGVRSKVAVAATRTTVDPVAALIGRDANRVLYISRMLGGERIDVVPFNEDLAIFAKNAMAPAAVDSVEVDPSGKVLVYVQPHQMPAAVGGGGLNSHLAGELLGYPVEVRALRS
jgi:N utilization substance protein A